MATYTRMLFEFIEFYTMKLRPDALALTLLYTIFYRKDNPFILYLHRALEQTSIEINLWVSLFIHKLKLLNNHTELIFHGNNLFFPIIFPRASSTNSKTRVGC